MITMPRCTNCGSTAQVKHLTGGAWMCGCGQLFWYDEHENKKGIDTMLNPVLFADLCDNIQKMNTEQLRELAQRCEERIDERRERFEVLCNGFYNYLEDIHNEFPNAHVYLCKDGKPTLDVMDFIIPQNTYECCEIGD